MQKQKRPGPPTVSMLLKKVPVDVKARFKTYCTRRGQTMSGQLIKFMRDVVDRSQY